MTLPKENDAMANSSKKRRIDSASVSLDESLRSTQSIASDSLFGEDIPLEEIENVLRQVKHPELQPDPEPVPNQATIESFDDDAMFGDDIPLDMIDESISTKASKAAAVMPTSSARYKRYIVASIHLNQYASESQRPLHEKIVLLLENTVNTPLRVHLRDDWVQTNVVIGDIVHIPTRGSSVTGSACPTMVIDNQQGYFIVQPDCLVSCTAVAESFFCLRKSVLQQKIKSVGDYSEPLIHGNIIHQVIQNALATNNFTVDGIRQDIRRIVLESLEDLFAIDQDESTAINILDAVVPGIKAFGDIFVGSKPKPNANVASDMGSNVATSLNCKTVAINRVLDIEEHLWSPTFGIKGMIDVSVQIAISPSGKVFAMPLELKTGKASRYLSHRAQTILYTLLMSDRYDVDIAAGALFYSRTNSFYMIPALRKELVSLLIARNELAVAMNNRQNLPPMVKNFHSCQYCAVSDACLIYHKSVENGNAVSSGLGRWFDAKVGHISDHTAQFFDHWQQLIDKEEYNIDYARRDIWRQKGNMREMSGMCFNDLILCDTSDSGSTPPESRYRYTFRRRTRPPLDSQDHDKDYPSMIHSQIGVGDPVVVSTTDGCINLGMGFVTMLEPDAITVSLTGPLRSPPCPAAEFDEASHQVFTTRRGTHSYRIDKDEMTSGVALMRNNLVALVSNPEDGGDVKRKRLIIDLAMPNFVRPDTLEFPQSNMNPAQRLAIEKVLSAQDYTLILGMPGTGKTSTIAEIIRTLVGQNKSVLVTAYTHTALDHVLSKVVDSGIDVIRLGNIDKVAPSLRSCVPSENPTLTSVAALNAFYNSRNVVGTTCLGIGHKLFHKRRFDYCIVDEASQITLPVCIGPLRYADKFVLVGDQYQLPPVVRDSEALRDGLRKSLFSRLAEAHPQAIVFLEYQYRMNKDIMAVSNSLVYDHMLKCGNQVVASKTLQLPNFPQGLDRIHTGQSCSGNKCWIREVVDPRRKVVFLNADQVPAREVRMRNSLIQNKAEASVAHQLVESLLACGMTEDQLAIISVYRSQLRLMTHICRNRPGVEIATIDKYQGRDKECVLISLVRSNPRGNAGELLRDWRRINVALTRAKSKLIIIGSKSTLETSSLYINFLKLMQENDWIYNLPVGADSDHLQISTSQSSESASQPTKKEHKTFTALNAILRDKPILRDIYNQS